MAAELTFKDIGEADMIAFLGYDPRTSIMGGGMIGVADGPSVCQPCDKDFCPLKTITEWTSTAAAQGSVCLKLDFYKVLHFTYLLTYSKYLLPYLKCGFIFYSLAVGT